MSLCVGGFLGVLSDLLAESYVGGQMLRYVLVLVDVPRFREVTYSEPQAIY